jgi:hypothetical protein
MELLKKWGLAVLSFLVIVLDQGFDVVNPLLLEIGIPEKWAGVIKAIFGFYAIYRATMQESPKSKLGGSKPPQNKDEK